MAPHAWMTVNKKKLLHLVSKVAFLVTVSNLQGLLTGGVLVASTLPPPFLMRRLHLLITSGDYEVTLIYATIFHINTRKFSQIGSRYQASKSQEHLALAHHLAALQTRYPCSDSTCSGWLGAAPAAAAGHPRHFLPTIESLLQRADCRSEVRHRSFQQRGQASGCARC